MTTPEQQRILNHLEGCQSNGVDMADLVRTWANCEHAEIEPSGNVYIAGPMAAQWISAERMNKLADWIEAQEA